MLRLSWYNGRYDLHHCYWLKQCFVYAHNMLWPSEGQGLYLKDVVYEYKRIYIVKTKTQFDK